MGPNTLYVWGGAVVIRNHSFIRHPRRDSVNTGTQKFAFPANWLDASSGKRTRANRSGAESRFPVLAEGIAPCRRP